nr:glycosyl transferase, family 8 [Tanacetum cinerariifolium]
MHPAILTAKPNAALLCCITYAVAVVVVLEAMAARGGEWCGGSSRLGGGECFWGSQEKLAGKVFRRRWRWPKAVAVVVVLEAVAARGGEWCGGLSRLGGGECFWGLQEKLAGKVFRRRWRWPKSLEEKIDDLMPTIEEGEVVEEFKASNDARMVSKFFGYPSDCDYDKKIRINCAYNLKFSCMIEVGIKEKRFEGMITIYNGNEEVTYQMAWPHPRFKHHTNEQCNKIPPLLKVSEEDKMNGISHSYQKLKGFYKGFLNLGPEYVRDAKMKEWLKCGHISVCKDNAQNIKNQSKTEQYRTQDWKSPAKSESTGIFLKKSSNEAEMSKES